jgi:SAM-dependent methyltransferase
MMSPPTHDVQGLHILDPNDVAGNKSRYITVLQEQALRRYLPRGGGEVAVDVGCGFGRLTPVLSELGWDALGIDPSEDLLKYAREHYSGPEYRLGGLPELPVEPESISLMLVQNVLRPLKMMGQLGYAEGIGRYLGDGARVVLVDNIRAKHPDFLSEEAIRGLMQHEGLRLVERVPLRAGRWWLIYLIRYGLVPESWFGRIADWELRRMARMQGTPRWQYWNVLFIFEKRG